MDSKRLKVDSNLVPVHSHLVGQGPELSRRAEERLGMDSDKDEDGSNSLERQG